MKVLTMLFDVRRIKARRRAKLRHRLKWIFFMDAIEGTMDCAVRSALK